MKQDYGIPRVRTSLFFFIRQFMSQEFISAFLFRVMVIIAWAMTMPAGEKLLTSPY